MDFSELFTDDKGGIANMAAQKNRCRNTGLVSRLRHRSTELYLGKAAESGLLSRRGWDFTGSTWCPWAFPGIPFPPPSPDIPALAFYVRLRVKWPFSFGLHFTWEL